MASLQLDLDVQLVADRELPAAGQLQQLGGGQLAAHIPALAARGLRMKLWPEHFEHLAVAGSTAE